MKNKFKKVKATAIIVLKFITYTIPTLASKIDMAI